MSADTIQSIENGTVRKPRKKNADIRSREFLTRTEVETLIALAKQNKRGGDNPIGQRHALMIQVAFNHGLRAGELVGLKWHQFDFKENKLTVKRSKNGEGGIQRLNPLELRALKKLKEQTGGGEFVFLTERGGPMSIRGFHKLVAELGVKASFDFTIHPHMLRHSKGYDLATKGYDVLHIQTWLGHKNIQNTVIYTKLNDEQLRGMES